MEEILGRFDQIDSRFDQIDKRFDQIIEGHWMFQTWH